MRVPLKLSKLISRLTSLEICAGNQSLQETRTDVLLLLQFNYQVKINK